MLKAVLNVVGMKCGGCETAVSSVVNSFAGVLACTVSAKAGTVEIDYDGAVADIDRIRLAIEEKGYKVV